MRKTSYVYIIGNQKPVLYIGVTSNLSKRVYQHKTKFCAGFSSKYSTFKLLYFELFDNILEAIQREKQLKHWKREWKLELIKQTNPSFRDLFNDYI